MKELDLHKHSLTTCKRKDGSLDPLRGLCDCGQLFESDPYSFRKRKVRKEDFEYLLDLNAKPRN